MIRFAQNTPQDTLAARKIWAECFGDPPEFLDWYFQTVYQPEHTLFYEDEGQLASHLQMRFFDLSLSGVPVRAGYLAGVATYPQFRKQGFSRALIQKAFSRLRANGANFCFLVPTVFRFYEQLGFAPCYDKMLYSLTPRELPPPTSVMWQMADENSGQFLDAAYRYALRAQNGYVLRSEKDWNIFLQDNLYNAKAECRQWRSGEDCGYYIARREANKLFVTEYGYTSPSVFEELLRQIALFGQNMETIEILAPPSDKMYCRFCDSRKARDIQPYGMARILSAEYALSLCAKHFSGAVSIGVKDALIAENNDVFHIQNHEISRGEKADIQLDIAALTMLFWGYIDSSTAYDMGLVYGDIDKATGLFQPQKNYLDNSVLAF
uniref:Acetyltransferase n=1 Tax=uncultured Bacillota bacterium TaxID=344338 RepID=A0A650ENP2_9FIRM|nr:acetyltransferase [uncultured Firmicutes bacterium]